MQDGPKRTDHFKKCMTPVYHDIGRCSVYHNVQLYIRSEMDILDVAVFKYSLHSVIEMILHQQYQLI